MIAESKPLNEVDAMGSWTLTFSEFVIFNRCFLEFFLLFYSPCIQNVFGPSIAKISSMVLKEFQMYGVKVTIKSHL